MEGIAHPGRLGLPIVLLLALAILGSVVAIAADERGVGTAYDSIVYVESARNLLAHRGLIAPERQYEASPGREMAERPLSHYPPLFPLVLAGIGLAGVDPLLGAQWLNAILLGALTMAIGIVVLRATGGSTMAALAAAATVVCAHSILRIHTMALSEPLFLLLQVAGLALISRFLARGRRLDLLLAAACAALAWLDRYVGVTIVAAGVLGLLLLSRAPIRRRVVDASWFGSLASLPMAAWLSWNRLAADSTTHRSLAWHPVKLEQLKQAAKYFAFWLVPENLPASAKFVLLALLVPTLATLLSLGLSKARGAAGPRRDSRSPLTPLLALFLVLYATFLLLSISVIDASTELDARALLPTYLCAVLMVALALHALHRASGPIVRRVVAGFCLLVLIPAAIAAGQWTIAIRDEGQGYANRAYRESELLKRVRALEPRVPLCSNNAALVRFLAGRSARGVPVKFDPISARANPGFEREMMELRAFLSRDRGAMILWTLDESAFLASEREILERMDLVASFDGFGGSIYEARR